MREEQWREVLEDMRERREWSAWLRAAERCDDWWAEESRVGEEMEAARAEWVELWVWIRPEWNPERSTAFLNLEGVGA